MEFPVNGLKFPAQRLCRMQSQLSVLVQKFHHVVAVDEVHLAWTCRFRGQFVWRPGNDGTETQCLPGFGHFEEENRASANRVSAARSGTMSTCCCCHAQPDRDCSAGKSRNS